MGYRWLYTRLSMRSARSRPIVPVALARQRMGQAARTSQASHLQTPALSWLSVWSLASLHLRICHRLQRSPALTKIGHLNCKKPVEFASYRSLKIVLKREIEVALALCSSLLSTKRACKSLHPIVLKMNRRTIFYLNLCQPSSRGPENCFWTKTV